MKHAKNVLICGILEKLFETLRHLINADPGAWAKIIAHIDEGISTILTGAFCSGWKKFEDEDIIRINQSSTECFDLDAVLWQPVVLLLIMIVMLRKDEEDVSLRRLDEISIEISNIPIPSLVLSRFPSSQLSWSARSPLLKPIGLTLKRAPRRMLLLKWHCQRRRSRSCSLEFNGRFVWPLWSRRTHIFKMAKYFPQSLRAIKKTGHNQRNLPYTEVKEVRFIIDDRIGEVRINEHP